MSYRPNKPVRQNQLISPWGIGQMVNFPGDESLMVAGLDAWEMEYKRATNLSEFIIHESRLQQRLGIGSIRLPPDYRDRSKEHEVRNPNLYIPAVRFPRWHYCYFCGAMEYLSIYESTQQRCRGIKFETGFSCTDKPYKPFLIPVRFVVLCDQGHIMDFPFMEWVHVGNEFNQDCKLRYEVRNLASPLAAILISCSCGKKRTMVGSFNKSVLENLGCTCSGERPWLGEIKTENNTKPCTKSELHVVQRGASNVYFPDIKSSIYVPDTDEINKNTILEKIVEEYWYLLGNKVDGKPHKERIEQFARTNGIDAVTLYHIVESRMKSTFSDISDTTEEEFRKAEYDMFMGPEGDQTKDYFAKKQVMGKYGDLINNYFDSITLIHKLRETRVLCGFTRWLPEDGKNQNERKAMLKREGSRIDWLPGIIVRGEGIFIGFNQKRLSEWEKRKSVKERSDLLIGNFNHMRESFGQNPRDLNARFVLLHTFAHLIINQFGLSCGYGSASLRERIYCSISDDFTMNGILIYTASGDSEGSLGGLVSQAKPGRLEDIVMEALSDAKWCSADPICISSRGQGPGSSNLAACHNCTLLPETSCEERNMLLDRGLIIGTLDDKSTAFFNYNN